MSLDYADLICRGLARKGEIIFSDESYSLTKLRKAGVKPPGKVKSSRGQLRQSTLSRELRSRDETGRQGKFIPNMGAKSELFGIPEMTQEFSETLEGVGYKTLEALADAPIARFMQETKLELHEAAGLINHARKILGKIKDSETSEESQIEAESNVYYSYFL